MRYVGWVILLSLGAALGAGPAFAQEAAADPDSIINPDRPGIADGSYVIGPGRLQVETAIQWEHHKGESGHDRRTFLPTLLRLGLDSRWELRIEGNTYSRIERRESGGISRSDGLAPTSIGVKYHFLEPHGPGQPSLGAIVRVFPPSGSGDFRTHHTTGDFRLAADWGLSPKWSLNPNVGIARYEDDAGRAYTAGLFATTLNYNPTKALNVFIDTGVQAPERKHGRLSLTLDGGIAYTIGRDIQLDLSAGVGAMGVTPPKPFVAAGFSKRFR